MIAVVFYLALCAPLLALSVYGLGRYISRPYAPTPNPPEAYYGFIRLLNIVMHTMYILVLLRLVTFLVAR